MSYSTPNTNYRSVEEHGMKRMGNHGGSIGSQHQLGAASGSGQNLMSESYQQEKGILKKPGPPYCGLDRLSSSSQNNLVNLTDRRDRPEISDVERTLKSLNGYHEDILEALRDAASTRSGVGGVNVSQGHSGLGSYPSMEPTPVLTKELKRHLAETRAANDYRSQQELRQEEAKRHQGEQDEMGPIRIRNLEDLIRQLEHSSNR